MSVHSKEKAKKIKIDGPKMDVTVVGLKLVRKTIGNTKKNHKFKKKFFEIVAVTKFKKIIS